MNVHTLCAAIAGAVAALSAVPAAAQVDTIVIRPDAMDAPEVEAASEGRADAARIESRPLPRPAQVLEAVPGVVVTQHSGSGKANQYFLRGFNLDHGTDFAVHVDGMPVNLPSHAHGQGYTDLNFLIPEALSSIQYRKGPYFADEGDFSAAGAAHLSLKRSLPDRAADVTAGDYGYRRALVGGGQALAGGQLLGLLELVRNDGPWENSEDLRKANAMLRYAEGAPGNGLSITAMAYSARWNATDQIPLRAYQSGQVGRFGAVDPSDGGAASRYSLSTQWARSTDRSSTRANAYLIRSELELFSNFTYFLDDPVNGDQFQQADRRTVSGGGASHTWATGRATEHTIGGQVRNDNVPELALRHAAARAPLETVRDNSVVQTSVSAYYENATRWTSAFRSRVGVRADRFRFGVKGDGAGSAGDTIVSPKLALVFGGWPGTEYFLDAGRGFHSNDARALSPLVRADGAEIGLRTSLTPRTRASLALWRLELDSELVFAGDAGTTKAGGGSRRQGVEWILDSRLSQGLIADVDASLSSARFRTPAPNHVPGAVERTLSAGVAYTGGPWRAGVRARYFGPRPLTEDGAQRSSSSTLADAKVAYAAARRLRLQLEVLNLFDRRADDITYFYTSRLPGEPAAGIADRHFHPAEPRTARLSLRVAL